MLVCFAVGFMTFAARIVSQTIFVIVLFHCVGVNKPINYISNCTAGQNNISCLIFAHLISSLLLSLFSLMSNKQLHRAELPSLYFTYTRGVKQNNAERGGKGLSVINQDAAHPNSY